MAADESFNIKLALYRKIRVRMSEFETSNWLEHFSVSYTHDSTAIEGNTLTLSETRMVLDENVSPRKNIPLEDVEDVKAHDRAFKFIIDAVKKQREISEDFIKDIHETALPNKPGISGMYRTVPVYIKGAAHVPPNYEKVREKMKFFIADNKEIEKADIEGLFKAAELHAKLVAIHPFQDGNGRTARLLMNYSLMKDGYPPVNIKKTNKASYFNSLAKYDKAAKMLDDSPLPASEAAMKKAESFVIFIKRIMNKELDEFLKMYKQHLQASDFPEDKLGKDLQKKLFGVQ